MPEVSVLIATFRRRELLQRALDSVYKQDFSDYELVVVDDCSPDDTPKLMHEMQSLDPRIRYIRLEENIGSKYGDREILRRFAAYWARGEYFIFVTMIIGSRKICLADPSISCASTLRSCR